METICADYLVGADESGLVIANPVLKWAHDRIISIESDSPQSVPNKKSITILAPGFINGHAHLEHYRNNPVTFQNNFGNWLIDVACEFAPATEEDKLERAAKSASLLLASGCTFVNDVSSSGQSAEALARFGMRGIINLEYFHPHHQPNEDRLTRLSNLYEKLQTMRKSNPSVFIGLSPHSPYNVSPCGLREALNRLKPCWIHTHLCTW